MIGLIDCDNTSTVKFPNLALMKISAYHKSIGDEVEWYTPFNHYTRVYVSRVFSFSPDWREPINADEIIRGGSGYAIRMVNGREVYSKTADADLPAMVEHMYPDYEIYGITNTAYGYLTRGCPRGCAFCHVAAKEGRRVTKNAELQEFWHGQKNIVLLDPNILAYKQRLVLLDQLAGTHAWVDFTQGLDARLLTPAVCKAIAKVKTKRVHFAWDRYADGKIILPKLKMFAKYNFGDKPNHNAVVYVLVNFDTTPAQDLERIYTLRNIGFSAYVMVYDKPHADKWYRDLARWCNNRHIFFACNDFNEYLKRKYETRRVIIGA